MWTRIQILGSAPVGENRYFLLWWALDTMHEWGEEKREEIMDRVKRVEKVI